jgi:nucleoside permease NupC
MDDLVTGLSAMLFLTCIVYFTYKARFFGVSIFTIILGYLFFPIAFFTGLYWIVKDIFLWYTPSKVENTDPERDKE